MDSEGRISFHQFLPILTNVTFEDIPEMKFQINFTEVSSKLVCQMAAPHGYQRTKKVVHENRHIHNANGNGPCEKAQDSLGPQTDDTSLLLTHWHPTTHVTYF